MRIPHPLTCSLLATLTLGTLGCVDSASTPAPDQLRRIGVEGAPSIDGWTLWDPSERLDDPRAGDPGYSYLVIGQDAVLIPGPTITVDDATAAAIFADADPSVTWQVTDENYAGLTIVVADTLTYQVAISDFEDEVSPIRLDLERFGDELRSHFVFAADGAEGVAFDVQVSALLDVQASSPTGPWTLEARLP